MSEDVICTGVSEREFEFGVTTDTSELESEFELRIAISGGGEEEGGGEGEVSVGRVGDSVSVVGLPRTRRTNCENPFSSAIHFLVDLAVLFV